MKTITRQIFAGILIPRLLRKLNSMTFLNGITEGKVAISQRSMTI
jgi:hypothetical protein